MFLWDKIGQLKNQGLSIDKIKEQLDIILSSKSTNESTKTYTTVDVDEFINRQNTRDFVKLCKNRLEVLIAL